MEEQIEFGQEVSTAELDAAVQRLRDAKKDYEIQAAAAKELYFHMENCQKAVTELLNKAGKSKYEAEGIGKVSLVERMSVKYPKDLEARREFTDWLRGRLGDDGLLTYLTFNSQSLQSFYKEQFEHAEDPATFKIPGIQEPTASISVRFNKA